VLRDRRYPVKQAIVKGFRLQEIELLLNASLVISNNALSPNIIIQLFLNKGKCKLPPERAGIISISPIGDTRKWRNFGYAPSVFVHLQNRYSFAVEIGIS
jgi:hypothetical protein